MTQSKHTKKALLASALSVVVCLAMLIGSTFAWFTDSVTSGKNTIVAGNLDVELYHTNGAVTEEETVADDTELFADVNGAQIQWEPGVVAYENFRVANEGSLALKYQLSMNLTNYNTVKENGKSLLDVLQVAVVEDGFTGTREDVAGLEFASLSSLYETGNLLAGESDTFGVVIYWEPSDLDNDYNLNNGKTSSDGEPLYIDLGVKLTATQDTVENDSFDNLYDEDAEWPWDGETVTVPEEVEGVYQIATAADFAWMAEAANVSGNEFVLTGDIDLGGKEWPSVSNVNNFTFDGQGHTIRNFVMDATDSQNGTGLFGAKGVTNATIKNVVIENAQTTGREYTSIVVGSASGCTLENITLRNVQVTSNVKWAGGVAGYALGNTNMKDITVEDSTFALEGGSVLDMSKVGAVAGAWQTTAGGTATAENITVTNCTVSGLRGAGYIIGTYDGRGMATMINCHAVDCSGVNYLVGEIYKGSGYPEGATLQARDCDDNVQSSNNTDWEVIE